MRYSSANSSFVSLKTPRHVWAIPSIHADLDRLTYLHDAIFERFTPGDRLVYLGNYTGYGEQACGTIEELVTFRRLLLAQPGLKPEDIVYLRGAQEEMLFQLMQLQFTQKPIDQLLWMLGQGIRPTLESYGICPHDGIVAAREGIISLTRWTAKIKDTIRQYPGHECLMMHTKRAAFTHDISGEGQERYPTLFVNAGLDPNKPLDAQEDNLWRAHHQFEHINESYQPFDKIVRGYDPAHKGVHLNCVTATLDGGCGFGGPLVGAGLNTQGEIFELMEA
ncbi:MAG: hypothetical protein MRY79_05355 [Alphaproteobacteria bacterium]|nr:hypothetical protein [Alphaproteobacteria bacterium]